jgi:hypothetical protein
MLRGVFETPFAVAASTNAGPALGAAPGGGVVLGVIVEHPLALGRLRDERETCVGQKERAQRFAQAPGSCEILIGECREGSYEPVLDEPGSEAGRVVELVGTRQEVQGINEVADELQVPRGRQSPVIPIGCHEHILTRSPDRTCSEGRRYDEDGRKPQRYR